MLLWPNRPICVPFGYPSGRTISSVHLLPPGRAKGPIWDAKLLPILHFHRRRAAGEGPSHAATRRIWNSLWSRGWGEVSEQTDGFCRTGTKRWGCWPYFAEEGDPVSALQIPEIRPGTTASKGSSGLLQKP